MAYNHCFDRIRRAAPGITDDQMHAVFERIHKGALALKAGRAEAGDLKAGAKLNALGVPDALLQQAAQEAAKELMAEAARKARNAHLQLLAVSGRASDYRALTGTGIANLRAIDALIARDYSGRVNVDSIEAKVRGVTAELQRKLGFTWNSLGNDFLGFFQDKTKELNLIKELRGEGSGDALAKKGAQAYREVAEYARRWFNEKGGDVGRLDDWGHPQHHSQYKVAAAGRDAWVDKILPRLDRNRYVDDLGVPWADDRLRAFLGKAWDTISTNGHVNEQALGGVGAVANRHAEHRQIHFRDAQSVIDYWDEFGEKTVVDILHGHVDALARDIAFVEKMGPNPEMTYRTLRAMALKDATAADPRNTARYEGQAVKLDRLWNYASGRTLPVMSRTVAKVSEAIKYLNVAGKLGGAMFASLYGDKPMLEAVAHLNNLPEFQRWQQELTLFNPANARDRRLLETQGLMLDGVRSGLQRFGDTLGERSVIGTLANAIMRITGMQAINKIRKGGLGASLMRGIGAEIQRGADFAALHESDMRLLRNYGITEADWRIWKMSNLDDIGTGKADALTPDSIARISDADMVAAGFADPPAARRDAIVKLLGAVNTEADFGIVTPGWHERATLYGGTQRGTAAGEIWHHVMQFKSFPYTMFLRGMDAIANADTPVGKGAMAGYLIATTTLAGAMIMQTRDMLAGKDPRSMVGDKGLNFWAAAFLQGGSLGIFGDFLYGANQTRYGTGPLEAAAGPTLGPLLEMAVTQPLHAIAQAREGKPTHLMAKEVQNLKGFIPGNNIWYLKGAIENAVWANVLESLSPGYQASVQAFTLKTLGQDRWWAPGQLTPERAPDFAHAVGR